MLVDALFLVFLVLLYYLLSISSSDLNVLGDWEKKRKNPLKLDFSHCVLTQPIEYLMIITPVCFFDQNSTLIILLLQEIQSLLLSLLSLKEAASTSIVSRNWRKLWTRYPNLCFDGSKDGPADMDSVKIERMKFIDTVNSIIQQHSGIGLNKFSIRCNLLKDDSDILDRWIRFATASKAKIIDMNLCTNRNNKGPTKHLYDFPLEAFGDQDIPFIQCLFLNNVSIKPHSDIGFTKLRSLHLHCVQIIGDLSGLLFNCSSLEDLEVFACLGVTALNIPHQLNKLRHLLICNMRIQMLEFHVPGLSHFEYKGTMIPIMLHGCSKLQKATLNFHQTWLEEDNNKVLGHVFHGIPSVSAVEVLNVLVDICTKQSVWSSQVHPNNYLCSLSCSNGDALPDLFW